MDDSNVTRLVPKFMEESVKDEIFVPTSELKKSAEVTRLVPKFMEERAKEFADQTIEKALSMDLELDTKALEVVVQGATKISYWSGDVESGCSRKATTVNSEQLLRAAKSQLYSYEVFEQRVRIEFDGEYIYDIYLDRFHSTAQMLEPIERLLELSQNIRRNEFDIFAASIF
ncbi:hypothetical protein VIBNISOn1_1050048 [Vibrio nigripulchritudo SOn1]|uniref:Uncharacterized protein n=1 Tax=Vibrio nigripulchritudo SOn1 TaxID=1238450 RepID=A0AAV2VHV8_9VIBR|nr:hypothetical protein [Vibrio nigripulchritudo]CCO44222.1 hypothetical protein VIBNISOn1_1050048 [Vibrio nigripulchritudo SOn1]